MSFVKYTEILPIIHSMIIKLEDEDETLGDPYLEFSEKNQQRGKERNFFDWLYLFHLTIGHG